jgi:hypothetical protein
MKQPPGMREACGNCGTRDDIVHPWWCPRRPSLREEYLPPWPCKARDDFFSKGQGSDHA